MKAEEEKGEGGICPTQFISFIFQTKYLTEEVWSHLQARLQRIHFISHIAPRAPRLSTLIEPASSKFCATIPTTMSLVFVPIAVLMGMVAWLGYPGFVAKSPFPSPQASSSPDPLAYKICTAHAANIAITGSGAREMTNMPHEVLDLDLTSYPFTPVQNLANRKPSQSDDAERYVLDAWSRKTAEIMHNDDHHNDPERRQILLRAVDWATRVFADDASRVEYLLSVWPRIAKSAAGNTRKSEHGQARRNMVREMDDWCADRNVKLATL